MTITKRLLFEFKDVVTVQIVCACGAAATMPLKQKFGMPERCHNCKKELIQHDSRDSAMLDTLMRGMADLAETKYPWKLQLEVTLSEPSPSSPPST
jgi:hypothetical protein